MTNTALQGKAAGVAPQRGTLFSLVHACVTGLIAVLALSVRAALVPTSPVGSVIVEMLPESQKSVFAGATQGERATIVAGLKDGQWREAAPLVLEWLATGGGSGLGKGIAAALSASSANVWIDGETFTVKCKNQTKGAK